MFDNGNHQTANNLPTFKTGENVGLSNSLRTQLLSLLMLYIISVAFKEINIGDYGVTLQLTAVSVGFKCIQFSI